MGPTIQLDKSVLQALSRREILCLHRHYYIGITPILLIEILADLKKPAKGRLSKEEVQILAKKVLVLDSKINVNYISLCSNDLLGGPVPMTRQIVVTGGVPMRDKNGRLGLVFDEQPERKALRQWQNGEFSEAERSLAEGWRIAAKSFDLETIRDRFKIIYSDFRPRSLAQLRRVTDQLLQELDLQTQLSCITGFMEDLGISSEIRGQVCNRWLSLGLPSFKEFAPYAYYCFVANMVFYMAIIWELITPKRTNRLDLEYVFYLPFCVAFSSRDNLHKELGPAFMDEDQTFVDGDELKADLCSMADYYDGLSKEESRERELEYGSYPPSNDNSITDQLWKKHMRPWKPGSGNRAVNMTKEEHKKILDQLRPIMEAVDQATDKS